MQKGKSTVPQIKGGGGINRRSQDMNRQSTTPLRTPRSMRGHEISTLTSLPAGRMVPIAAAPLLREDAVRRGNVRLSFEMHETEEILMNAVNVTVKAYLVPFLALGRFSGMDALNRSYQKVKEREADSAPVPFFGSEVRGAIGTNPVLEYLGLHAKETDTINTVYNEAYNAIWNFRALNRSLNLTQRLMTDKSLAPAFWQHNRYKHIVPRFDQAMIDGEVALNIAKSRMPVKGVGFVDQAYTAGSVGLYETGGSAARSIPSYHASANFIVEQDPLNAGFPAVFAELEKDGITVSLSNIEMAKKTVAFAKLREQYNGHSDEYIIDMLMAGLSVPEQAFKQPILLASQSTVFGLSKRYATDAANLTESVVNGATFVDLSIRVPQISTGGIIMIVAECVPDQLFERQQDPLLTTIDPDLLPQFLRDELDPEKVDVVKNAYVDTDHAIPDGVFGYEPLHAKWDVKARRAGGRFLRPKVDGDSDEARMRLWSVEHANPTLNENFYLATDIHTKPFKTSVIDPFEVVASGQLVIEGNTVFGGALIEASDNYAKVLAEAPTETIDLP